MKLKWIEIKFLITVMKWRDGKGCPGMWQALYVMEKCAFWGMCGCVQVGRLV